MALIPAAADLDRAALARGLVVGVLLVGPMAALSSLLIDPDDDSNALSLVFFAAILLGFGVAGAATARSGVVLPYTHGALAGLATFAVVQAVVLAVSAVVGRDGGVSAAALVFNGLLAASAGMIGAMLVSGRSRRGA